MKDANALLDGLIVDITASVNDVNPEDTIYKCADGTFVKVKTILEDQDESTPHNPGNHGHIAKVSLTGSICNSQGKALVRDGKPVIWILDQTHHFKAEGDDNPLEMLDLARRRCVAQTLRAEKHFQMLQGSQEGLKAPGLVSRGDFTQRKLMEGQKTT